MTQQASETKHPTDAELEAMAARLEQKSLCGPPSWIETPINPIGPEAADMLRACKGRAEWANNPLTHKLLESRDFEEARAEALDAKLKEAVKVMQNLRSEAWGYEPSFESGFHSTVYHKCEAFLASLGDKP